MRDREAPGPEGPLIPGEARQVAYELEEDLAGQILRFGRSPGAEVAKHRWGEVSVDLGPSPVRTRPCRVQNAGEAHPQHGMRPIIITLSAGPASSMSDVQALPAPPPACPIPHAG